MKKIYWFALAALLTLSLPAPLPVHADTIVTLPITSDTTWSPQGGVYVITSEFRVEAGATLTIEAGTIVKARVTVADRGGPSIFGRLITRGTSNNPVYFTSFSNDTVGGDTNGDGIQEPTPGSWQGLYFKQGSYGELSYTDISYAAAGGYGWGNFLAIQNEGELLLRNVDLHDNYANLFANETGPYKFGYGIFNKGGILEVENSTIDRSTLGIFIESGTSTLSHNTFKNNTDRALTAYGNGSLTLLQNTFTNNKRTAHVDISKLFIHEGNVSEDIEHRGYEMSGALPLGTHTILPRADLPYIFNNMIVEAGATFEIGAGAIIKIPERTGISVFGNLLLKGTREEKIYIVSLRDDTIGGDTNGDSSNTLPQPRSWGSIFLENGSHAEIENAIIRHGGFNFNGEYLNIPSTIYQRGADLTITDSTFEKNYIAIFADGGTTTITHGDFNNNQQAFWTRGGSITVSQSSFDDHIGPAIYHETGPQIDARNNWWGEATGPRINGLPATSTADSIQGDVLYIPFLTSLPTNEQTLNPVIIVPGIMGSWHKNDILVLDPILRTYDDLIETLLANGYERDVTLFPFPYEWRDSNVGTARIFKQKIDEVKSICECEKVDVVAHSMGGLVAREYIQSFYYDNDIDQTIFLGTPHKGSSVAYLQWEAGKNDSDGRSELFSTYLSALSLRAGYATLYDYIQQHPISSVQELLPISDYLKDKDTNNLRDYPFSYPQNRFLENLNSIPSMSRLRSSGVEIKNIIGDSGEDKTIETIRVVPSRHTGIWEDGEPDGFYTIFGDKGLERGKGDNTVTLSSASLNSSDEVIQSSHNRLPTLAANRIVKILTGKDSVTNIDNDHGVDVKILLLQLLSPIDMVVTAPDGEKIGKDFSTGVEYSEIPNAFYSGYQTENEYIAIINPLDGEYKIQTQGTDSGEYHILSSYISDATSTTVITTGVTSKDQFTELDIQLDNDNPSELVTERQVTLELFVQDIENSYNLKWIKDRQTRDSLIKQVKAIVKFENKKNGKLEKITDKILARMMETELKLLLKKGKITEDAFNLFQTDLKFIIKNN